MNRIVISDTSCFIAFDRINQLEILQRTFGTVLTTPEVVEEFGKDLPLWVQIRRAVNSIKKVELERKLDKGEASAIALALEIERPVIIIDEKKGRKIAKDLNLEVIGSLKVLLIAKSKGVISEIYPVIRNLENLNFRFSKKLVSEALRLANEQELRKS